ncbi:MAG: hypothetical protein KDB21_10385 [Acidimicrobiales bacterium]|nr:hypothetical protein [Acidimicrobiales bacterium]
MAANTRRVQLKCAAALGAALFYALQPAAPAAATVKEVKANVYVASPYCTEGKATLESVYYGGAELRSRTARTDNVTGMQYPVGTFCYGAVSRPAGYIRAGGILLHENEWCVVDEFRYTTTSTDTVQKGVGFHDQDLPCGNGYYKYTSISEVLNGSWNGGPLTTGQLYFTK